MRIFMLCLMTFFVMNSGFCQGRETFANLTLGSFYATGSFTGDDGVLWQYVQCRDDNNDAYNAGIEQPAIMLRSEEEGSAVSAFSGEGGVGQLKMKLYRGFSSTTLRQVDVYVDGLLQGTSPGFNDTGAHEFLLSGIDITGNVQITIRNTKSAQIIVDDVEWSAAGSVLPVAAFQTGELAVFPNPVTQGRFRLKHHKAAVLGLKLYTFSGQLLSERVVRPGEPVDVRGINPGTYLLNIREQHRISNRILLIK